MIDTLEIWTTYDPVVGGPDASEGARWTRELSRTAELDLGSVKLYCQDVEDLSAEPGTIEGSIYARINVPALLGVRSPNEVWKRFHRLPQALEDLFAACWWGEYPAFQNWRVSRLDAAWDFHLDPATDIQALLETLRLIEVPNLVPATVGKRGHVTVYWKTQGAIGRPARNPDIIRMYDKARELEDRGAPEDLVKAFRGVLRFEYEVRAEHGVMQRAAGKDFSAPVFVHEIVSPLRTFLILRQAHRLLRLERVAMGDKAPFESLRKTFGDSEKARSRYQHYCWILRDGEAAWAREFAKTTRYDIIGDLRLAGLWPPIVNAMDLDLRLPFAPKLAGGHLLHKFKGKDESNRA